jgi:alkylated DNA repair dioxygenase AlkB
MFQGSLFGDTAPRVDQSFALLARRQLDEDCWLDFAPEWLSGADTVFDALVENVTWQHRTVTMYERRLPEPRLTSWWAEGHGAEPHPVLRDIRTVLSEHYGESFDSIGFNWYRDGNDSVAWHGDRRGPRLPAVVVAILSVGDRRPFRLRPKGGGQSMTWDVGHGDLLVMGGACQRHWEHTVPKVRHAGPRISVTFRHSGVS